MIYALPSLKSGRKGAGPDEIRMDMIKALAENSIIRYKGAVQCSF